MNLDYLVSGGDKYQVFITIGSVPVYMFLTASAVGRNLSQDATPIGAISTEKPIAVKRGIKNIKIVQAAKLAMGSGIHDFRDFPANTNITVTSLENGSVEKYIGCAFSGDNKNIERNSLETLRELSGTCIDYKSV